MAPDKKVIKSYTEDLQDELQRKEEELQRKEEELQRKEEEHQAEICQKVAEVQEEICQKVAELHNISKENARTMLALPPPSKRAKQ